jgi:hypothetical protein
VVQRQVAIMAYGSLITQPGAGLKPLIVQRIPCPTPFRVEYGRASRKWGGGPVLVPHRAGGPVNGQLLVLQRGVSLGQAVELLAEREGLPSGRGVVEVADAGLREGLAVIAASLPRNLPAPDMAPLRLAERAVASTSNGPLNGIAYLAQAVAAGIETPATVAYVAAVLALTGAASLEEAEGRLLAFPRSTDHEERHGLG